MRRVFLENAEIPALLVGVARGDPVAMRRILGARRGGRVGVALGLLGLLLAASPAWMAWLIGLQLLLGLPGGRLAQPHLSWLEYERLSLWLAGAALIAVAPLRPFLPEIAPLAIGAVLAAHLWLWRSLRSGLSGRGLS